MKSYPIHPAEYEIVDQRQLSWRNRAATAVLSGAFWLWHLLSRRRKR